MNRQAVCAIPKIIHYCWFGGSDYPEVVQKCIASWKKYLPDFELRIWNETSFDINSNRYVKQAYQCKKYAFVSDYVRLYALYHYGGVYLDTDVEVLKPLDTFLVHKAFSGFENKKSIPTGIIGSVRHNPIIRELLSYYDNRDFLINGSMDLTTNVTIITSLLSEKGLRLNNQYQVVDGFALYPQTYFCPISSDRSKNDFTDNTHTIHHFTGSWLPLSTQKRVGRMRERMERSSAWRAVYGIRYSIAQILKKVLGNKSYRYFRKIIRGE